MKSNVLGAAALVTVLLSGGAYAAPVQWNAGAGANNHWYEFMPASIGVFATAVSAAASNSFMGMTGYLATVTSADEQAFLNASVNPSGFTSWLGGSDAASEGNWMWVTEPGGPIAFTYTNWAGGEPNNFGGGENGLLGWWSGDRWNDIYDSYNSFGYIVEYNPATVPVPASIMMMGLGLGGLAVAARRRGRKAA